MRADAVGHRLALVLIVSTAGCAPVGPSGTPAGSSVPSASGPSGSTTLMPSTPPSSQPSAAGPGSPASHPAGSAPSAGIPFDHALVELLPETLDGLARQREPDLDAELAVDPGLAAVASSFGTGLYIDPSSGEFAYAAVIRLGEVMSDEAFRDWRQSYDDAACSQAGGVAGTAQATIGGHRTFIGSCHGGVHTYHFLDFGGSVIVSVTSLGERRLGERLVAAFPAETAVR